MTAAGSALLAEGEAALARGDWATARTVFAHAVTRDDAPDACYGLARAAEWAGDYPEAVGLYERAFAGLRARGETRLPAVIAGRELSFLHAAVYGNGAAAGGWLARARSLADESGDCLETGWVELAEALASGDAAGVTGHALAADRIAARFSDPDLHFCALAYEGAGLVLQGQVAAGMRRIDEAAVAALHGEVRDHVVVGEIYCKMLLCCEVVLDVRRAEQWAAVANRVGRASNDLWVSGICLMHLGGVLIAAGRWREAEDRLVASLRIHDAGMRALRSGTAVRLGDLRTRQGRWEEAGVLLEENAYDSAATVPLARLHLAMGDAATASAVLRRAVEPATVSVPQVPALALLAEVMATGGAASEARRIGEQLQALSDESRLPHVCGLAERTAAALTEDGAPDGPVHLRAALLAFGEAGLPWEGATTRLDLARRLVAIDPASAAAEGQRALRTFRELGAQRGSDEAAHLLRSLGVRPATATRAGTGLTPREKDVLRLMVSGRSNDAIAGELFLSKRTVEHHVSSVLAKLGVSTRAEAMARAVRDRLP
jgi:DNA-binding CsgD family transcriptional regulator/tetratricopeptide (TPR) repeat protein